MTKKSIDAILANMDIMNKQEVPKDRINEYDKEVLHQSEDGKFYLVQKNDLDQADINIALLVKLTEEIQTIKYIGFFFVALTIINIILTFLNLNLR
jgi:hypothetical protein